MIWHILSSAMLLSSYSLDNDTCLGGVKEGASSSWVVNYKLLLKSLSWRGLAISRAFFRLHNRLIVRATHFTSIST